MKKNPAKMFMVASFLVFILTSFVYIGAIMSSVPVVSYPYDDIFHEDSITASQGGEAGSSGAVPTSYKEEGAFLVPVGITTGISFSTDGIMVIGTSDVVTIQGKRASPSCGKLKAGDIIIKINSREVENIGELSQAIEKSQKTAKIELMRDGKRLNVDVDVVDSDDNTKKIGCWVRDATQGIGTITYYNPIDKTFGALGHGVFDVDTQKMLTVREGQMLEANIIDIRKGEKGKPGELIGEMKDRVIGHIEENNQVGIYGKIDTTYERLPVASFAAASRDELKKGPAKIFSNIEGGNIKSYDVFIENINEDTKADKAMVVRITDQTLLTRTNGIVQGMSGSPIMQNDKLLGAITHVFVQNPARGYGVHIDKMVKACSN